MNVSKLLKKNHQKAFSMVELVVVIALLGLMAIAVETIVPSLSNSRLNAAAKQILSDIQFAKQNAMITTATSGAQFLTSGTYTVYQNSAATPLSSPLTRQDMIIDLASLYPGVVIDANYTVEFDELGSPTTGGGGTLTISSDGNSKSITITQSTGKVSEI